MSCFIDSLTINQGETFYQIIQYTDGNNQPIDLTGCGAKMQFRPQAASSTLYLNLSSSLQADGTGLNLTPLSGSVVLPLSSGSIGIQISAYSSSLLNFDNCVTDLFITSGSGSTVYTDKIYAAKVKLIKSVTII